MLGIQSLIDEVASSLRDGTPNTRALTLRRITDLLLTGINRFEEQHVGVFDDVLCGLIDNVEREAVAQLSHDIAELSNAPRMLSRLLSRHDDIQIAGPILRHSDALGESDVLDVAQHGGQLHLEAIASRSYISERTSDVLINRGSAIVLTALAGNAGARFSTRGYKSLAAKAESDENIASALIGRPDSGLYLDQYAKLSRDSAERVARFLTVRGAGVGAESNSS